MLHRGRDFRTDFKAIQSDRGSDRHVKFFGPGATAKHLLDRHARGVGDESAPPRVNRGHKAELRRLTVVLGRGETLALGQSPERTSDLHDLRMSVGLEFRARA